MSVGDAGGDACRSGPGSVSLPVVRAVSSGTPSLDREARSDDQEVHALFSRPGLFR